MPETGIRPKAGKGTKRTGGLPARTAAAALCVALALGACSPSLDQPGPETGGAPLESGGTGPDTEAPRLLGVKDITVMVGGSVSYRDGVSALDDVDGPVPFQVDAGAVDLSEPGEYPVVYSAEDAAGNRAEEAITVTVEPRTVDQDIVEPDEPAASHGGSAAGPVTEEEVNRLADQILGRILRDGMSQREQARAIFNYVNQHIRYVGTSDKSSWIVGAHTGFTRQRGDCYNYFACSKALLTRAGIPNIDLTRVGGNSRHYWQLVNTGDGWYHFDACPHPTGYPMVAFMITETQARTYTERVKWARQNYYVYDYDACPVEVEGTPPEGWRPPVSTPPPAATQPPAETVEPPVATEEPPAVTEEPPVETAEPPVETPSPEESQPPVETMGPPVEVTGPSVEATDPPAENPPEQQLPTGPIDDWANWPPAGGE